MKNLNIRLWFLLLSTAFGAVAHEGRHDSVHDTVAAVLSRMQRTLSHDELIRLTAAEAQALLTPSEREVLGSEHIRFRVNVPVIVTVAIETNLTDVPFWLRQRGFVRQTGSVEVRDRQLALWEKAFPAGHVGLGVHNLSGQGMHYLALIKSQEPGDKVKVSELYPAHVRVMPFVTGVQPFSDQEVRLDSVPGVLEGQLLLQTAMARSQDARLVNLFSRTAFPSSRKPDQVVLTWSGDPRTTQTIQWRTAFKPGRGALRYHLKSKTGNIPAWNIAPAGTERMHTPMLVNDPLVLRHAVTLTGLQPDTTYRYSVGDGSESGWTEPAEFTTAPAGAEPFSFIYMGDAQNGLDRWGQLLAQAHQARPDAAFYLMAGDLVNRGAERWDWDSFFEYSKEVFNRRTLVPVIGNHECQGGHPRLYLDLFTLATNGPAKVEPERAYAFEYSNAKFIVLDSNLPPESQAEWLEEQLASTKATWKFVSYHHPVYASTPKRDNAKLRNAWMPLFDKYHVDLALQGHDHAYLRTYPMRGEQRVATARDGTIYIISVSGTKHYAQAAHDYTEVGFTKVSTYQVLDIQIQGNRLVYRAHDMEGKVRDEFVIEK